MLIIQRYDHKNNTDDMRLFISSLSAEGGSTPVDPFPPNGVRVFLYTGQSNCPGRGLDSDATAQELAEKTNFKIWSKINSRFENLQIGVNNLNSTEDSHGIELGLSNNFESYYPNETVYFIKWGVHSTAILEHLPGGSVYDDFWPNYVIAGINDLIADGKIPFVYWVYTQGERDSNTGEGGQPELYGGRFDQLISQWQSNIGVDMPMCNYELCDPLPSGYDQTGIVNQVFADKSLTEPLYQVMPTKFLSNLGDDLHYDYTAQKQISILALDYFEDKLGQRVNDPL